MLVWWLFIVLVILLSYVLFILIPHQKESTFSFSDQPNTSLSLYDDPQHTPLSEGVQTIQAHTELKDSSLLRPSDYYHDQYSHVPIIDLPELPCTKHDQLTLFQIFTHPDIPLLKRLHIGNDIIWKSSDQYQINHVYNTILQMIDDRRIDRKIRMNAIDMLIRSNNSIYMDRAKQALDTLRREEQRLDENTLQHRIHRIRTQIEEIGEFPYDEHDIELQAVLFDQYRRLETQYDNMKKRKATVYNDSQNVHNHAVNESVLKGSHNIVASKDDVPVSDVRIELQRVCPSYYEQYKDKINESIQRLETDTTKFRNSITIQTVYKKILSIIFGSIHRNELIKRLAEELVDMYKLCATGHLSRLINVLQGFEDIPEEYQIKMDPKDEIYASLSTYITSEIQSSEEPDPDTLLMDMVSQDKKVFYPFLIDRLVTKYQELQNEYKNVLDNRLLRNHIKEAVRNYLNDSSGGDVDIICDKVFFHTR